MKTLHLLLLVALTATAESRCGDGKRTKRDVLVRTKRRWVLSTIELTEELDGDYPIEISRMFNNMSGGTHEFRISGNGVELEPKNVFYIEPDTGLVCARRRLDREQHPGPFHIQFDIIDKYTKKFLDTQLAFDVALKDINDNEPKFQSNHIIANVKESWTGEYLPLDLHMTDKDLENTINSTISVSVLSQSPQEPKIGIKQINNSLAHLTFSGCFDYEKIKMYQVIIQAKDHGNPSLSSTSTVTLNIVKANTHPPKFKKKEYYARVNESTILNNVLRVAVDDQDKPQTPGWRAKYYFIKGNEEKTYKIETDQNTNEGILSVIKGMDYENKKKVSLQIGVENEEPLFVCKDKTVPRDKTQESAIITLSLIDVNDPPYFKKKVEDVRLTEEEEPGKVLFKPEVNDTDSEPSMIRFVLLEDPANWVKINKETGAITSIKKMDRESPFLNGTSTYKVVIGAIDNGKPPATGTCTVLIHLRDLNDNVPQLVNKNVVMCGNKVNEVRVLAEDADAPPFTGPFFFSLGGDVKILAKRWKLEPTFGIESMLVSQKTLPYGNYSVPLEIRDQQSTIGKETLQVILCDCGEKNVCRSKKPVSVSLGSPAIGVLFLGLLLFLLLLFIFMCTCGKEFKNIPVFNEEGKQTLIMYNQEGGVSECKAKPNLFLPTTHNMTMTDQQKGNMQMSQTAPLMVQDIDGYNSPVFDLMNSNMSLGMQRPSVRHHGGQVMNSTWGSTRNSIFRRVYSPPLWKQGDYQRRSRSVSVWSDQHVEDQLNRRLNMIDEDRAAYSQQEPHNYAYEGQGSICQSLDQLSLSNLGDDLTFLNTLGPKFKTLGAICQKTLQEKKTPL